MTVLVGLQIVIFSIWGDDGDSPNAVVAAWPSAGDWLTAAHSHSGAFIWAPSEIASRRFSLRERLRYLVQALGRVRAGVATRIPSAIAAEAS